MAACTGASSTTGISSIICFSSSAFIPSFIAGCGSSVTTGMISGWGSSAFKVCVSILRFNELISSFSLLIASWVALELAADLLSEIITKQELLTIKIFPCGVLMLTNIK